MGLDLEMLRLGFLWNKEHGCPSEQLLFQLGHGAGQAVLGLIRAPTILLPPIHADPLDVARRKYSGPCLCSLGQRGRAS